MSYNFRIPSWAARNPLGIIALFISLIYGMSALLLGASIKSMASHNQTILVIFVAVFPFVVLGVFGWLVANHHRKLYGPGDYQSDQGFLAANTAENPASLGERLEQEIKEEVSEEGGNEDVSDENGQQPSVSRLPNLPYEKERAQIPKFSVRRPQMMARAYVAQSLVFQELQNELGGAVQREVMVRSLSGHDLRVSVIKTFGTTEAVL